MTGGTMPPRLVCSVTAPPRPRIGSLESGITGLGDRPSWPRVWNCLQGGADCFQPDRDLAAEVQTRLPGIAQAVRERLQVRRRLVRQLAGPERIEQFLVIGAEPSLRALRQSDLHAAARAVNPGATTVHVAHDRVAESQGRGVMCSEGSVCIDAARDDPAGALAGASNFLDLACPIAVLMIGNLELLNDRDARAWLQVIDYLLPSGSRLAVAHLNATDAAAAVLRQICRAHQMTWPHLRSRTGTAALLHRGSDTKPRAFTEPVHEVSDAPEQNPLTRPRDCKPSTLWAGITEIGGATYVQ
ncbi:SAM-dependent methyltransferase [Actinomadura geliboluensis]|uniref:SAM-dependent methyltransferase n=1 Tax=Actinomadura geliboluensis TaxID=882440 RepID=UPI00371B7A8D